MSHDFSTHRVAFKNPWLTIYEDNNWYALTSSTGVFGGGGIIMDSNQNVLLVEIYRYPIDKTVLEIPRGLADPGEKSLSAAVRETAEETGVELSGARIIDLGIIHPDDGILAYENSLCAAILPHPFDEIFVDKSEVIGFKVMPLSELKKMIVDGEVNDSHTIAALLRLEAKIDDGSIAL